MAGAVSVYVEQAIRCVQFQDKGSGAPRRDFVANTKMPVQEKPQRQPARNRDQYTVLERQGGVVV